MIYDKIDNKQMLSQITNNLEFLYVEKANIEKDDASICIVKGNERTPVPVASINCLLLGPGTTITHRAVEMLTDARCTVVWCGTELRAYYATGYEKNRSSKNLLKQIEYFSDTEKHIEVARKMYEKRFPQMSFVGMDIKEMRGLEGLRMKEIYSEWSEKTEVQWNGRYTGIGDFAGQDDINKLITVGNQILYHCCRAAIHTLGYSPAIGFIHTGRMDSFTFDIADLYKTDVVIPTAFETAECLSGGLQKEDLAEFRKDIYVKMKECKLLKQILSDLLMLFDESEDMVGLWNGNNEIVSGGTNYGTK